MTVCFLGQEHVMVTDLGAGDPGPESLDFFGENDLFIYPAMDW